MKNKIPDNMFFERSCGYAGYRCYTCGTWEYLENVHKHKCPEGVTYPHIVPKTIIIEQ